MQVSHTAVKTQSRVMAVLGPTNTGKTYYAIERMAACASGVIGFPLRLLARENYDRLVQLKGEDKVALVTGEEKIIPPGARYFSCTVESMPVDRPFDFLAVDEIQLCADPDRGHVFTDRLLRARGLHETLFVGADTIRPLLAGLVPGAEFVARDRLSQLTYRGYKKLTRLPPRSAIVAFSIEDVYAIAELIRRQRGGTAVVLGALSPRTRNKQVEMYQNGEVDFMVATDAIGMGLNMDIHHVALSATRKYDGSRIRTLERAELAQIAGRAGRHTRDGTFGVTGRVQELDADTVEAIENHKFDSLKSLCWRNSNLDFSTLGSLLGSLEKHSGTALLVRGNSSDDYLALAHMMRRDDIVRRAQSSPAVQLLWEVCQIPDFRKTLTESHQELVAGIFQTLIDRGTLSEDSVRDRLERLDRLEGDVDTLMARIAHIRTWTYITHKSEWLHNAPAWAEKARQIEDRLSDALHEGLMKRFVDRRSAVLIRALEEGGDLLAGVKADDGVVVEGQSVGRLEGFVFVPDEGVKGADYKAVMTAARNALKPEIRRRVEKMMEAQPKQFRLADDGGVLYQPDATNPLPGQKIAALRRGAQLLQPAIDVQDSPLLQDQDKSAVEVKIQEWLKAHIGAVLEPLMPLTDETGIEGTARGIAFQLHEALGILPRADLESLISGLDEAGRAALRQRKVRLGPVLVFLPALNKPAAVRLRALLWSLWHGQALPAAIPPDGMTSLTVTDKSIDPRYFQAIGYPVYGPRAIRVDMLDRLISAVYDSAKDGKFQARHDMAEWLGCSIPDLYAVLEAMGHRKVHDPADEKPADEKVIEAAPAPVMTPEAVEAGPAENKPEDTAAAGALTPASTPAPAPASAEKPQLATFQLRRGRAYGQERPPRPPRPDKPPRTDRDKDKKDRPRGKKPEHRKKENREERQERIISARPKTKPEDSPFSILQSLKAKNGEDKKK